MKNRAKHVILGSDAVRALLFRGHTHQAEVVAELEVAGSYGYTPLYPAMTLSALDFGFREGENRQLRRKLNEFISGLDKGSFIGVPSNEEWLSSIELLQSGSMAEEVEFADVVVLSMAIQRGAAILTVDKPFISYLTHNVPEIPIPPFQKTLEEATGEAKPM